MFLKTVKLKDEFVPNKEHYPFSIPALARLNELTFEHAVTFFVGENGSGKSTLLEGLADQIGFNPAGGSKQNFQVYDVHAAESALGDYLRLSWMPRVTEGFFLRAETFYQFASHIDEVEEVDKTGYRDYGGKSLHAQSHGESFFSLFQHRFKGNAIYLLDEPEAALSPNRQLAFLRLLHDLLRGAMYSLLLPRIRPFCLAIQMRKFIILMKQAFNRLLIPIPSIIK